MAAYVSRTTRPAQFTAAKSVLYIDRKIIVLNKPPGLVCQGLGEKPNPDTPDLQVAANRKFTSLLDDISGRFKLDERPYPVHRLDRGTTGSMVLARTPAAARDLSQQFQDKTVQKTYLALVRGGQQSFGGKQSGKIRVRIAIKNGRSSVVPVMKEGKASATDWDLLASSPIAPVSLVRLKLLTGIKHQLRVHLSEVLKTPILGDTRHSETALSPAITNITQIPQNRLFLHSSQLSFYRYRKSRANGTKRFRLSINAPLPRDFLRICAELEIPVSVKDERGGLYIDDAEEPVEGGVVSELNGRWFNISPRAEMKDSEYYNQGPSSVEKGRSTYSEADLSV